MLLGLMGKAQSGKDTAANYLALEYGFLRVAFADALREMLYALNPIVTDGGMYGDGFIRLQQLVDSMGWDDAKKIPEVRALMQRMGTEAVRAQMPDFWIQVASRKIREGLNTHGAVVVTDCRFFNEIQAVQSFGGHLLEVVRPGYDNGLGENAQHSSETEWGQWCEWNDHAKLVNDMDVFMLQTKVDWFMEINK